MEALLPVAAAVLAEIKSLRPMVSPVTRTLGGGVIRERRYGNHSVPLPPNG